MALDRPPQVLDRRRRPARAALAAGDVVGEAAVVGMRGDQLDATVGHGRVLPRLVERPQLLPDLVALDPLRQPHPRMPARPVARLGRRRERRIGERAHHDDDKIRLVGLGGEDRAAALGAEVEDVHLAVGLVGRPRILRRPARDPHAARLVAGLHPEGATRPPLARQAVADADRERLSLDGQPKLPAAARRLPVCHQPRSSANAGSPRIGSRSESSAASLRSSPERPTASRRWAMASSVRPARLSQQATL